MPHTPGSQPPVSVLLVSGAVVAEVELLSAVAVLGPTLVSGDDVIDEDAPEPLDEPLLCDVSVGEKQPAMTNAATAMRCRAAPGQPPTRPSPRATTLSDPPPPTCVVRIAAQL